MKPYFSYTGLGFFVLILLTTGCASRNSTQKRINALEAQVGVLTDEMARLDQSLQEARGALASAQTSYAPSAGAGVSSNTLIYRTPSGFELPSRDIQQALKGAGYYQGAVDGKIGPASKEAVKAFQRDHGLDADGVVGRRTWEKLKVYLTSASA